MPQEPGGDGSEDDPGSADPPTLSRDDLSWVERQGALVLLGAAFTAWVLAAVFVGHDVVAGAWVVAGFVLVAGAAFFQRVSKLSREGVELRDIYVKALEEGEKLVVEGDTTDERRARAQSYAAQRVIDLLAAGEEPIPEVAYFPSGTFPSRHQSRMEADHVENNLIGAVFSWLASNGYEPAIQGADDVRSDLIARKNGAPTLYVEARPAVEVLRPSDARAVVARSPIAADKDGVRVIAFREGVFFNQETRDILEQAGIALLAVDVDKREVRVISPGPATGLT